VDWGQQEQDRLVANSSQQFGVGKPLADSSSASISQAEALAHPEHLMTLANGLKARVVAQSSDLGTAPDQIALWPNSTNPQWLIACNEEEGPSVIRVRISDGHAETILNGFPSCDPVRRTDWGTILFGNENGTDGHLVELIDPLHTSNAVWHDDTATITGADAGHFVVRRNLGRLSYEGLAVYRTGLTYYSEDRTPASGGPGGAILKFVPDHPHLLSAPPITALSQSPLASGNLYGLQIGATGGDTNNGQGAETGQGAWVPVCSASACTDIDLEAASVNLKLTGYYRPEDAEIILEAERQGQIKFCFNMTGDENANRWGETVCFTDGSLKDATANAAIPEAQIFQLGNPKLAMVDNIAEQPTRQNLILHEDAETETALQGKHNNDLWDCLPDGTDDNLQSDGCVRIATLNDLTAEWTGGIFDSTGKHFYVSVQHNISGEGTIFDITGWK
jgi:hypothetical protein